ncbi:MAG: GGDEF domain-containing protein [Xanthomonadales bacterium]|nr:GGDEF domain-containing protein [Xanthomonadales bacterium]
MAPATARDAERGQGAGLAERLRQDFVLAIMVSAGGLAIFAIALFAVYRFHSGNVIGAAANVVIVLALATVVAVALRSRDSAPAAAAFVVVCGLACLASTFVFGRTGAYWGYLVLWLNFVLTRRELAGAVNLVIIGTIASRGDLFGDLAERLVYTVSAVLVTLFAWGFSARYAAQRRQLELLASHDPLTGAGNRRLLQRDLETAVQALRGGGPVSTVAVLDLDHFKRVNDSSGHEAGDRVLVALVEVLRSQIRRADGLYRFGGEEFVVLLRGLSGRQADQALSAMHLRINEGLQAVAPDVTVSIGGTPLRTGETWSTWLARADAALYRAKQAGRNRVEVDPA